MIQDGHRCPSVDEDSDWACSRDWYPIVAHERRRESKHEDEPGQWAVGVAADASGPDPDLGVGFDSEPVVDSESAVGGWDG